MLEDGVSMIPTLACSGGDVLPVLPRFANRIPTTFTSGEGGRVSDLTMEVKPVNGRLIV